ncbi:hypothetical protein SOVF_069140 [Spinacia oleracea]|uniref:Uncharacterized protein isoform X2 n=1 Tax=Spinacia oleracea TaxID=3562 RepID=A0A9R0HW54_SPIOL|nr:uncharacterized protein LOC110777759 isoform X2 [Spinacia oleracea]KNA18614.1 hypothetical protein SOVF_069140 [Spinacia oleracea]
MADIEPPSFSLGLDLDFEPSQNHPPIWGLPTPKIPGAVELHQKGKEKVKELEDYDEFELRVSDSEPESPEISARSLLLRLRRGGPSFPKPISTPIFNSVDDDIEEFSDEEIARTNDFPAPQHHSSCSSSKLPLSGCGVLVRQQESDVNNRKGKQDSSCPSTSLGSNKGKAVFPNLTASPLRRFQLLDSESDPDDPSDVHIDREASRVDFSKNNKQKEYDIRARFKLLDSESEPDDSSDVHIDREASRVNFSKSNGQKEYSIGERFKLLDSESEPDDPSVGERVDRVSNGVELSKNIEQKEFNHGSHRMSLEKNTDLLPPISQKQDLWKDFCVSDKCAVQTPVFDELCKEYFQAVKSSKPAPGSHKFCSSTQELSMNDANIILQHQDSGSVFPPSHHYFFHIDLRIQRLVRSRLPHFFPLTATDAGSKSHKASSIDYMSQFGQDDGNRQTGRKVSLEKSSRRGRKKSKNSSIEETSIDSGNWINPKQTASTSTPTDAARRRIHADGQSAGQWLTENGRKVYITKNGKELTGRLAYRHYRKESGRSFKKIKKKGAAKKK